MSGQTLLTNSWMLSIKTQRFFSLILPFLSINSQLPTFSNISEKNLFSSEDNETFMLVLSSNLLTCGKKLHLFREAFISSSRVPPLPRVTTGRIWRKSHVIIIAHPPKFCANSALSYPVLPQTSFLILWLRPRVLMSSQASIFLYCSI